jgi:hypothetical protein
MGGALVTGTSSWDGKLIEGASTFDGGEVVGGGGVVVTGSKGADISEVVSGAVVDGTASDAYSAGALPVHPEKTPTSTKTIPAARRLSNFIFPFPSFSYIQGILMDKVYKRYFYM